MGITMRLLIASLHVFPMTPYLSMMSTCSFSIQSSMSRHDALNSALTSTPPTTRRALSVDVPLLISHHRRLHPNSGSARATLPLAVAHKAQRRLLPLTNRDNRADIRVVALLVAAVASRCARYALRWGISHIGQSIIPTSSKPLHLKNIHHVPSVTRNLLCVKCLTLDNNIFFEFHPWYFLIKDRDTKEVLLS
jgi:hypothetical protein